MIKQRVVVFHAECIDGFTAAWAAWLKFGDKDTEYLPARYGDAPPNVVDREVFVVDFSYPREVMLQMKERALGVLVLDHHRTAEAALEDLDFAIFDMERSGAGMAWDFLCRAEMGPRPWLISYVEDRDLWRFKLANSKAINAWIGAFRRESFQHWNQLFHQGVESAIEKGEAVLQYVDRYVSEMAKQARFILADGYDRVPLVNAPYINTSELVGHLAEDAPFAIGWFQRGDGVYQYSLRSNEKSSVDVSKIAAARGGGGHYHAAGFTSKEKVW